MCSLQVTWTELNSAITVLDIALGKTRQVHMYWSKISYLEGVWLSEVGCSSDPHCDPDIDHLSCDMAERQVADHYLLSLRGVCEAHMMACGERSPR